jgi:translation initiation factor IF-3
MRLAEDVKEIGQIESPPLQDGRNMVMVLGPTKNAGVKSDAEDENTQRSEEAVQGDRRRQDLAPAREADDAAGSSDQERPREAEARPAGQAGRA